MKIISFLKSKFADVIYVIYIVAVVVIGALLCSSITQNKGTNELKQKTDIITEEQNYGLVSVEPVTLVRVVDGDTVIVNMQSADNVRVRLIGVDTPESVNPDESKNTEAGKLASNFTKSKLNVGQTYYLEYDKERKDDYGRILAYFWLVDCTDVVINDEYIAENMFNAVLLENGYAKTMKIEPNVRYANIFEKLEK